MEIVFASPWPAYVGMAAAAAAVLLLVLVRRRRLPYVRVEIPSELAALLMGIFLIVSFAFFNRRFYAVRVERDTLVLEYPLHERSFPASNVVSVQLRRDSFGRGSSNPLYSVRVEVEGGSFDSFSNSRVEAESSAEQLRHVLRPAGPRR